MRINNNNIKLYLFSIIAVVLLLIIINIAIPKHTKPKKGYTNLGNDILRDVQRDRTSIAGLQYIQTLIDDSATIDVLGKIFKITNNNVLTLNADISSADVISRGVSQAICQIPCGVTASHADLHWNFQSFYNLGQPGKYSFTIDQTSGINFTLDKISGALTVVIGSVEYHDNGAGFSYETYCHCDNLGYRFNGFKAYYKVPLYDLKITLSNIALNCTTTLNSRGTITSVIINNINIGDLKVNDEVIRNITDAFSFGQFDLSEVIGNIIKPIVNSNLPKNIPSTSPTVFAFNYILNKYS